MSFSRHGSVKSTSPTVRRQHPEPLAVIGFVERPVHCPDLARAGDIVSVGPELRHHLPPRSRVFGLAVVHKTEVTKRVSAEPGKRIGRGIFNPHVRRV
jgi:hypothetical protein